MQKYKEEHICEYEETDTKLIVAGPYWYRGETENKKWSGWTIQEVCLAHDLCVEGCKMEHCLSDTYRGNHSVDNTRIFSLRDPANHPHITIVTDNSGMRIKEMQKKTNQKKDCMSMICYWVESNGYNK